MGTTIRREPVNFAIPDAPDYKFLNITNFRGLDVSSNPFELANNTASDCLNVYVDETNTLTTRPRLEKKMDTPLAGTHIGTYNLHNGYLLHYLQEGVGVLATWIDNVLTQINGKDLTPDEEDVSLKQYYTLPTVKCQYFEQDDKIYLLDGERYMVISENTLSDVEGYVPITVTTDLKGNEFKVESLNLLTNKYERRYDWNIDTKLNLRDLTYVNQSFERADMGYYGDGSELYIQVDTDDDSNLLYFYIMHKPDSESEATMVLDLVGKADVTVPRSMAMYFTPYNNKIMWLCNRQTGSLTLVYNYNNTWKYKTFSNLLSNNFAPIFVDDTGYVIVYPNEDGTGVTRFSPDTNSATNVTLTVGDRKPVASSCRIKNNLITFRSGFDVYVSSDYNTAIKLNKDFMGIRSFGVLQQSRVFVTDRNNNTFDVFDGLTGDLISSQKTTFKELEMTLNGFDDFSNSMWYIDNKNEIIVIPDILFINENHVKTNVKLSPPVVAYSSNIHFNNKNYIYLDYVSNETGSSEPKQEGYKWVKGSSQIIVFNELEPNTPDYVEWDEKRQKLFKSTLVKRFDNNYWFASGNRYYRSQNNDPTYFPITEYNDLGDSNEEITGFNLANDETLIAYKKNRLYLIQPFTSSLDTREYIITESKNTVGNTAIGASIVTTLTEIPLQLNSDGIYGLSQLQNVSAVERIADLMSEPINEKWLKEDDVVISNAKTINRLYWTYVILPYEDKTKVYLLDNRSNSWYYWELSIVINDAFVKDNVTEFVDKTGVIYYLTPEDVINKAFLPLLVTEYYDYGRKLIPWYWQSQILHLGTMNYSKRLVNTTFILTDTDTQDGYGLQYSFKVFRKLASSTPEKEISDELNLVRSTTKKTNISKFGFVQLKLSNITEESQGTEPEKAYRNNKLRLVGLGLKYVLLEGLIR